MFDSLRKKFLTLGSFSNDEIETLVHHFKVVRCSKSHAIQSSGMTSQSIYFVDKGSFRQFEFLETAEEVTLNFFIENDWLLDYKSFTSQRPATSTIQANEDSILFELNVYDLHKLMKLSDSFFQIGRIFQYGVSPQEPSPNASPKARYALLLKTKPKVIQKFQLKHIASFLNMTPETLSRVRKNII